MRNMILVCLLVVTGMQAAYAKPKNMTYISHRTSSQQVDIGETGNSVGDINVNIGELFDAKKRTLIGTYVARHIIVVSSLPRGNDIRDGILQDTLPGGTLLVEGIVEYNAATNFLDKPVERPIVGGTGKFAGARGVRISTPIPGQPGDLLVKLIFK
jgi:hypothetical protein